jgi:hypothetical protein
LLAGEDCEFEDEHEDSAEELLGEELDDEADGFEELDDAGDDMIEQTVIREEIRDDRRPPKSGPTPRGDVIDFDEDSPPPLQPKKVREQKSSDPSNRPLRAEPRTSHRRGGEQSRTGQSQRRGQRHRQEEGFKERGGRPDRRPRPEGAGRNPRAEQRGVEQRPGQQRSGEQRGGERSGEDRAKPLPKRPGKLVAARPQEDRGARGKYPGKSFGKGKKYEGGGGRGAKTIFGKRVKKKNRGRP